MDIKISQRSYLDISEAHDLKKLIPVSVQARTKKKKKKREEEHARTLLGSSRKISHASINITASKHHHHHSSHSSWSNSHHQKKLHEKSPIPLENYISESSHLKFRKFHRCMRIHGDFEEAAMAATNRLNQQRLFNLIKVCNLDCSAPTKLRGNFPYLYGDGESCRVRQAINSLLLKTKLQSEFTKNVDKTRKEAGRRSLRNKFHLKEK